MRMWLEGRPLIQPGAPLEELLYETMSALRPQRAPVVLRMRFVFEADKPRTAVPTSQPSLPALVRGALDVLCGIAWENEKQIVALHAGKEYGNVSGTEIIW